MCVGVCTYLCRSMYDVCTSICIKVLKTRLISNSHKRWVCECHNKRLSISIYLLGDIEDSSRRDSEIIRF